MVHLYSNITTEHNVCIYKLQKQNVITEITRTNSMYVAYVHKYVISIGIQYNLILT